MKAFPFFAADARKPIPISLFKDQPVSFTLSLSTMANSTQLSIHLHLCNPHVRSASKFIRSHRSSWPPKTHPRFSLLRSKRTKEFGLRALQDPEDGGSYLHMWKKAVARSEMGRAEQNQDDKGVEGEDDVDKKSEQFMKILEIPVEERDKVQRLQVIDRAAAAIAAAKAILSERPLPDGFSGSDGSALKQTGSNSRMDSGSGEGLLGGNSSGVISSTVPQPETSKSRAPGPDFWSWSPPIDAQPVSEGAPHLKAEKVKYSASNPIAPVMEMETSINSISIPFESKVLEPFQSKHDPPLPPLQSLVEVNVTESSFEVPSRSEDSVDAVFSTNSAVAASVLGNHEETSTHGKNEDGSRWWRETGVEQRADGVVCRWTLLRGVSASKDVEWEEKYWEASDQFDYKELGSEKSGRDAAGNVWREYWRESMWQDIKTGLLNIEKTADKWGKNGKNEEWQEKWWERYDASGFAEKWAHKWCCIDPFTPLEAGHAHVWHERWGEKYNGQGSSMKYTDKWAERLEGDGWTKWGDKWDESFDDNGHGVKQGETWWQGAHGERWNRTWGERHNGSGWIHKYGKSSSGEHWDTHVQQETWYEKYPHYGFQHCYENSEQLKQVQKPKRTEL